MLNLPIKILETQAIEDAQADITFTGIAALVAAWDAVARVTSRHLVVIINAASADGVTERNVRVRFNGDGGANYNTQAARGIAAAASAFVETAQIGTIVADIPGALTANAFGGGVVLIPHAFNAANHKAILTLSGAVATAVYTTAGRWMSNNAITSLSLVPDAGNFAAGSTINLGVIDERYLVEEWESAGVGTAIFDNIPQGEGDLVVIGYARSSQAAVEDEILHYINDDGVAGNYPAQELMGRAAAVTSASPVNGECAMVPGQTAGINVFGALAISYFQYTKGNQPHFLSISGYHSPTGPLSEIRLMSGRRANIEPINKIELDPTLGVNFFTGSLLSLYRIPKRIIERRELAADAAVVTFDNIPQNFEALQINVYARTDVAAVALDVTISLNNDGVAANYNRQTLFAFGGAPGANQGAANNQVLYVPGANEGAGQFSGGSILLPGYAKADRHKHILVQDGAPDDIIWIRSFRWENLNAVTRVDLTPVGNNFVAGTVVELEGILRREGLPSVEGQRIG